MATELPSTESVPNWRAAAEIGDFPTALTAWQAQFADHENTPAAEREGAELEERWGDWLWFSDDVGAGAHFRCAMALLMPPGRMFSDHDDHQLRMSAWQRINDKCGYGSGPDGRRRANYPGVAHPNSRMRPAPAPASELAPPPWSEPEPKTKPKTKPETTPEPQSGPTPTEFLSATASTRLTSPSAAISITDLNRYRDRREHLYRAAAHRRAMPDLPNGSDDLFHAIAGDHWAQSSAGDVWLSVAHNVADAGARRWATARARQAYAIYHEAWTAGLPASRFDADLSRAIAELDEALFAMPIVDPNPYLPPWLTALLRGRFTTALPDFIAGPLLIDPAAKHAAELLAITCIAAGRAPEAALLRTRYRDVPPTTA